MPIKSYQDLTVWRMAMVLAEETYSVSRGLPVPERYGMVQQMRRAAVSIPSNIAEGFGRAHLGDYLRFLSIANGSLKELETQVILAVRLGYVTREGTRQILGRADELGRMLNILQRRLRVRLRGGHERSPLNPNT